MIVDRLSVDDETKYDHDGHKYTVKKISKDECIRTDVITGKRTDLRKIIFDTKTVMRVVWQFQDDDGRCIILNTRLIAELLRLPIGSKMDYKRDKRKYIITKVSVDEATQKNTKTNKVRRLIMTHKLFYEMDKNWVSKGILSHYLLHTNILCKDTNMNSL